MKKIFFLLIAVCFALYLPAQSIIAFHEDFEMPTLGDSLQDSSDPAGSDPWTITTNLRSSGLRADSNSVQVGYTVYLTTNAFSTVGYSKASLQFAQICKLYFSDGGSIEISIDGGNIWTAVGVNEYRGSGNLITTGGVSKFSESAYSDWLSGDTLTKPTNAWWKTEVFDISLLAANQANVKIRFKYIGSGNPSGAGRYGWLLDDIKVMASNNELMAPSISFKAPILKDTLFVTGPFTVKAYVKDSSVLATVNLIYNTNGGADISIPMTNTSDSTFVVDIPSYGYNTIINYKVQASDIYNNTSYLPSGYQTFVIKKGAANVQIGTATTSGLLSPVYIASATDANLYSYNVALFEKAEILSGGTIESLAFSKADAQGYTLGNATLRIYLKSTSATSVPATYASYQTEKNGAIKVYESTAQNLNTAIGWQTFTCNTGSLFSHNGSENLLVFVEWYRPGNASGAINWHYNTAAGKSSIFYGAASTPGTTNTTGQRANMKINFQSSSATYDATVLNFASPSQTMTAGVNVPVTVRVKNLGSADLSKVNVHWMADGVYMGMINWTGNLLQDFVGLPLALGNVNFAVGPHVLKAWTSLPNDSIDQQTTNDTTTFNVFACQDLSGIYTVGLPSSNFPTINDMFTALNNCGISGPVTFKIASATYNQQLIIPLINNVSATNTLTFESASGNKNDVIFQYSSTGTADNFVLKLDASKYVKVKNISFKALGSTYGRVAELANSASYNTIEGCLLEMPVTTSSNYAGIYTASTIEQYNAFRNNTILNGYYGIYNYGTSTSVLEKGNIIEGNTVSGFYYYGIYSYYQDSVTINGNIVENGLNSTTVYGIYAYYNDNLVSISKNKVYVHSSGTSTNYAIYVYYCDNTAAQPGVIANNFSSQSGTTGTVYGLANYYSTYQNYYFNSVNVTSGSTSGYAFYATGGSNVDLYNNNFVNTGGGYAYYISTIASIVNSNYNNLYASGTNLAYWSAARTDLAALQAASSKDMNSISLNPGYVGIKDLHVTNFALYGTGTSIPAVTNDIDSDSRATPPCIGADEFIVPQNDAGIVLISSPTPMITTLNQDIKVRIKNFGVLPLTSATIQWSVNGVAQTPYSWIGSLSTNASDTVILGNFLFNLGLNTLKVYSEAPNTLQDVFNFNDTLLMDVYACAGPLNGNYTIGGSGATYPSVKDALIALKNCGVSGAVVFNINPGTYNEQFIIPKINGTSAANTITFKSANNDSTSVIFDITAGGIGNYVLRLDSAQYIKFTKLTMKNEISTGRVIEIAGNTKYCEITSCILRSNLGTTSSTAVVIYGYNSKDEYNIIKNNQIYGGYYGIYWYGIGSAAGSKEVGNLIQGNLIKDFYYYGLYAYYQDSLKIIGNTIQNISTSGTVYGLYGGYADNTQYLKNNIQVSGSSTAYCMYIYYNNNAGGNGIVANNFISQSVGTAGVYGLYSSTSTNINYYYNSVNVTKGSSSGYAFYITGGANCNLINNIFSNTGGGYAYYASSITAINTSNYNNIYATGTNLAYWSAAKTNLSALQLASGKDANSISTNPIFFSATDLHTDNVGLFAKGTSISTVNDDIDGQIRVSLPCIGADEFVVMPNDARVKVMYTFGKLPKQPGSPHFVKSIIKNMGSNMLTNLDVTLDISGSNNFTSIITIDTLLSGVEDTIVFDSYVPVSYGISNVQVYVPSDDVLSNNVMNYRQDVTDTTYGYADTSAATTYLGFNTGSGLFVSKYHVNGSRVIKSARVFITNSNTVGQVLYGVILDQNGVILDSSLRKTITASDANSWVTFNFLNQSATTTINSDFYIGIAQTIGTGGYYPLGCQAEVPTRKGAFYYTTSMTGGSFTEATSFGRFMIEANLGLPAPKDAAVNQIITPVSGCGLANEIVKIKILNTGLDTIYGGQNVLTAHYGLKYNGNLINVVSQTVADIILPAQIKDFTFTTPLNLAVTTADSNYHLTAWVDLAGDYLHINDTLSKIVKSKYTPPTPTVTSPVNISFSSATTLTAISNDSVYWYANLADSASLASGLNFTTPVLYDTTTYWVAAGQVTSSGSYLNVGMTAASTGATSGAGTTNYGLVFDALSAFTLHSVTVYPVSSSSASGTVTVDVVNSSGVVLNTATFNVTGSPATNPVPYVLTLNFPIAPGTNLKMKPGFSGISGLLFEPSAAAPSGGYAYPYVIPGVVSINTSTLTAAPTNTPRNDLYYYFYNWEVSGGISSAAAGCQSPRTAVVVNVAPGSDASITKILTPNTGCGLSNQSVKVRIKNRGNLPIIGSQNVLTAHYGLKLNGNIINVVNQLVPNTIIAGDSLDFTFNTLLSLAANVVDSNYTIVAWNTLVNDLFVNNDTTTKAIVSKYTPSSPVVSNLTIPYASAATFNIATTDSIYWYANLTDSLPIASGNHFTTPLLFDTTTYYVLAGLISTTGPSQFVGPLNTSIGAGGTIGATSYNLLFDVLSPNGITIKNVDVYPATSGSAFTMVIKNSSDVIIQTYNGVTTTTGTVQTVNVNFQVPLGSGYKLGYTSGPSFYRNTAGATFPYTIPNVVSLTGTSFSGYPAYYYNAYNWEVYTGFGNASISGCTSAKVPVTAIVTNIPALDVAVTSITEPLGTIIPGVALPVKAKLTNYGTSTVTSANLNWMINGVVQSNTVPWSGSLSNGQSSAAVYLGDFSFPGGPNVIRAWSSSPNTQNDMYPVNDTATGNVIGCMTGNFTIGAGGTFPTFVSALNMINAVGLCGNVIFDVLPGTYNEAITINQIPNSGPNATITFRAQNGINTSVILTNATAPAVVRLLGADYIRFEKINIKGTGSIVAVVELSGGANNNVFDGNIIEMPLSTSSTNRVINSTNASSDNYNQFINNSISGAYYGIYWYGSSAVKKIGNQFINNTINDFYYYGMYIYYNDSVTISKNSLANASNSAAVYGLYSYYTNSSIITKNKLNITGSGAAYCMYIYYNNSTGGGTTTIANNFVSQSNGVTTLYGIYNYYSNNVNYYNNSVHVTGGTSSYYAFYSAGGSANNVVNNIFSNTGGGYAYYVSTIAGINISNYNDFYASGTNLAYWTSAHTSLASLKTTSGKDVNSIAVNPNFFSATNLHLINFDIDGKATALTSVTDDIDDNLRNTNTPDIGADEFDLPNNDAGIIALNQPLNPAASGLQDVKVIIKNFGLLNLTSANIQWMVNGVLQTTTYSWTGNLATGSIDTVNLGTYNFSGNSANLKAWTILPNGVADQLTVNDTLMLSIVICNGPLAGNYTIGGATANFLTISQAVQSLAYCGVDAAVTFNINPGIYNEQIRIPSIIGASAVNSIVFKSLNNDSSSVVISYNVSSSANNYIVKLDAAKYVRFKHLSFVNNTQTNLGRVVELANAANYNEFSNNVIQTPPSTVTSSAAIYSYNTIDDHNLIANNLITGGYYGIYLYGVGSSSKEKGNIISNNIIKDFYYYGLYLYYQDSITVTGNSILNGNNSATAYGMYSYYSDNNNYQKNKIILNNSGSTYAMYIYYNNNTAGNGIIANNFISQSLGTGTVYGIYNYYSTNIKYYYNSVNVTQGTATSYGMYFTGGANNTLRNNSIVNTGSGYAIYAASTTAISSSNYNNIFATGASLGYWGTACTNLNAWQTASAKDTNSISVNPDYLSSSDLHVYTSALNNLGTPLTEITDDIDGQQRSTTIPDIGADEFAPLPIDIGVKAILDPTTLFSQAGGNVQIRCIIKNFGADSVTNFNIVYKAGSSTAVSQVYPSYLHANQSDTITFTSLMPVVLGPFEIKVFTSINGDGNHLNDTLTIDYFGIPFKTIPYAENFDNSTEEWYTTGSSTLWEKGIPAASVINTAHSAPNVWATKLNANYPNNNVSMLYTPIFNNAVFKADTLKFWHWVDAELNKDGGYIEYQTTPSGPWLTLGQIAPDTNSINWYNGTLINRWTGVGAGWQESKYKVSNLTNLGNTLQFRFVFMSDASNNNFNGWAIDDFALTLAPIPADAGVIAITSPTATSLVGDIVTVTVTVKNFGTDILNNIPVKYQVGSGPVQSGIILGPIVPGAIIDFTFIQTYHVANVNFTLCAYTEVVGDIYVQNDQKCNDVVVNPAANDVGITEITQPGVSAGPGIIPIKVTIKNYGTTTQTSIPVSYQRGTQLPVDAVWTGSLAAGASVEYTFATLMNVPSGSSFSLAAYTKLANDAYVHNDTTIKSVVICNIGTPGAIAGLSAVNTGSSNVMYKFANPVATAVSYNWYYSGNDVSITYDGNNKDTAYLSFGASATGGILSVKAWSGSCEGNASVFSITIGVGVDNIEESNFYLGQNMPNPTTSYTSVEFSLPTSGDVKFDIMNVFGQKVYSSNTKSDAGKHIIDLNVNNLSAGIYYYAIEFKGKRLVKKMIVSK